MHAGNGPGGPGILSDGRDQQEPGCEDDGLMMVYFNYRDNLIRVRVEIMRKFPFLSVEFSIVRFD